MADAVSGSDKPLAWLQAVDVFVTGATGFVGTNLARRLIELGARPRALVRPGSRAAIAAGPPVTVVEGSLEDRVALARAVEGCAACLHLAAAISGDAATLRRVNIDGARSVLEAAAGCPRIVHVSTMGTLSRADGEPARETDRRLAEGASDYVRSKFEGEAVARALAAHGAPVTIVHPAAPVGPHDHKPTVTGRRIVAVLEGRVPSWIRGRINHVAVADVVEGILLAAATGAPGQSYLLASREGNLTLADFLGLVARAAGIPEPRVPWWGQWRRVVARGQAPVPGAPATLACDPSWTIASLGLPQTPLEEAFRAAVRWFRERPSSRTWTT